ncbi:MULTISPECIES: SIR2 family protein [Burkholderia]|uniref:SIR2 family protein n=1 Tax=Burkholderia TaxID=32008 RepID=UPI0009E86A6D|nr:MULTISPECIES: SIR2 family protein [Burkholderia]
MVLGIDDLLPSLAQSLEGIGFLFGAGASREAGYPMMAQLTRNVVGCLSSAERVALDTVLSTAGRVYDDASATPNIEELADFTIAHALNSGEATYQALEERFRELIVSSLLGVVDPVLDCHIKFFENLQRRTFGLPCTVWVFTTNYDLLLETAAAIAGVTLENGFSGATTRFFDVGQFNQVRGTIDGIRFAPQPRLVVKLIKLHGSLSWIAKGAQILEQHPGSLGATTPRTIVLPRRRKVMDTLAHPYDLLFSQVSRVLGTECRYLISCGFSFGDEHINQTLLLPALRAGKCRLTALCDIEPVGLSSFKSLPSVSAAFSTSSWKAGSVSDNKTELWKFSAFAAAF